MSGGFFHGRGSGIRALRLPSGDEAAGRFGGHSSVTHSAGVPAAAGVKMALNCFMSEIEFCVTTLPDSSRVVEDPDEIVTFLTVRVEVSTVVLMARRGLVKSQVAVVEVPDVTYTEDCTSEAIPLRRLEAAS